MRGGVSGRGERADRRVAQLDDLAVAERDVLERDARPLGQVRRGSGALDELRQAGHVVGLHVRLEHGHDRDALRLGQRDVAVDEVDVRIDDREARLALAPEQVGRARGCRR